MPLLPEGARTLVAGLNSGKRALAGLLAPALAAIAAVVIYGVIACTADSELGSRTAAEDYYNRLTDGFLKGQLSLDLAAPAGLARLNDPYDPRQNAPFQGQAFMPGRFHDLSYFHGKLYLYFSAVPAAVLFLPYRLLTGSYLSHQQACFLFASLGLLAAAALVESIRRRHFPGAGPAAGAVAILCIGLASLLPVVLQRPDVWEVPITGAFAFWMLALLALWIYAARPATAWWPLLGASTAVGLAIGCRPNSCLGGLILLWPLSRLVGAARPREWVPAAALVLPPVVIGTALLAYNLGRFGDVLNFGQGYQIAGDVERIPHFLPDFIGYNFRLYFLEYPGWQRAFPFVRDLVPPPEPPGYVVVETPVALTQLPFVLCLLALPLGWRRLAAEARRRLKPVLGSLLLLLGSGVVSLCLYFAACVRYELEFVPALLVLAAIGFLALVDLFPAGRGWRWLVLGAAGCTAAVSIGFNLLMAANLRGLAETRHGVIALQAGRLDPAARLFQAALRLRPVNVAAWVGLSNLHAQEGNFSAAGAALAEAIRLAPQAASLHLNYAYCLARIGRLSEAIAQCEAALRLQPDLPAARDAERQIRALQRPLP